MRSGLGHRLCVPGIDLQDGRFRLGALVPVVWVDAILRIVVSFVVMLEIVCNGEPKPGGKAKEQVERVTEHADPRYRLPLVALFSSVDLLLDGFLAKKNDTAFGARRECPEWKKEIMDILAPDH